LIFSLFVGILFLFGCVGDNLEQLPIRSLTLTIDPKQREELFDQLHRFGDKHGFEFTFTDYGTSGNDFLVELLRKDINVFAVDIPDTSTIVSIRFYNHNFVMPVDEKTMETIDELSTELKILLNEIPNVIIQEELKRWRITMDENQRGEVFTKLFNQFREFADYHSLEFSVSSYDSDRKIFLIEMEGDGFQISSQTVLSPVREIDVEFYIHYDNNGAPTSLSQKTIDELFTELQKDLEKIPNVTIEE
jgi:hypothetical protein